MPSYGAVSTTSECSPAANLVESIDPHPSAQNRSAPLFRNPVIPSPCKLCEILVKHRAAIVDDEYSSLAHLRFQRKGRSIDTTPRSDIRSEKSIRNLSQVVIKILVVWQDLYYILCGCTKKITFFPAML